MTGQPGMWSRLVGQDEVVRALREAVSNDAVSHALLFAGPEGVGRRPAALALAASLNCPERGCGECAVCRKVLRNAHPDVHLIVPEGQFILLGQIKGDGSGRGVIGEAFHSPIEGKTKVFIIEDAERMNPAAANALLKVLEEPPQGVVFILMTAHPEDLPETIASRCGRVDFSALPEAAVVEVLTSHHGIEAERAAWAARIGGNLARALRLAHDEDAPARYERHVTIPVRCRDGGIGEALRAAAELQREATEVTAHVRKRHTAEIAEAAEAEGEGRGKAAVRSAAAVRKRLEARHKRELRRAELDAVQAALDDVAVWYREQIAAAAAGDALARRNTPQYVAAVDRIEWTRRALDRNVSAGLALEALLVELAVA